MAQYYKVEMALDGWGLLVNEGTAEDPKFRVIMKGSEHYMERLAADLNRGAREPDKVLPVRRHD